MYAIYSHVIYMICEQQVLNRGGRGERAHDSQTVLPHLNPLPYRYIVDSSVFVRWDLCVIRSW